MPGRGQTPGTQRRPAAPSASPARAPRRRSRRRPDARSPGRGVGTLTRRQLGRVQVVAGRGAQVGKRVDFGQEHPNLQGGGAGTVPGGAAAGAGAGVVPANGAGAGAAAGVAAAAAAGAEGRGRVGGQLGALAAAGRAGTIRQRGRRQAERLVELPGLRCGTQDWWLRLLGLELLLLIPPPPPPPPTTLRPPPPPRPLQQTPGSPRRQE